MDLLEKIHFNKVIHDAMVRLHKPLLSHEEIQEIQTNLNNLLKHCSLKQIIEQTHTLIHQVTIKSIALSFAEETNHFDSFIGTVFMPIELVEHLTQHKNFSWGIFCKNNDLWQIMLKYDKNIEHSIWVENLNELKYWLDSEFAIASKHANKPAFGSSDYQVPTPQNKEVELQDIVINSTTAKDTHPKVTEADFDVFLSEGQRTKKTAEPKEIELPSLSIDENIVNPFALMREQLETEVTEEQDTKLTSDYQVGDKINFTNTSLPRVGVATSSTYSNINPKVELVLDEHSDTHQESHKYQEQINQAALSILAKNPAISTNATTQHAIDQLTPDMIDQIATVLAKKLQLQQSTSLSSLQHNTTTVSDDMMHNDVDISTELPTGKLSYQDNSLKSLTEHISKNSHEILLPSNSLPSTKIEPWDCEFELGSEVDSIYFYIQLKNYFTYLNLITVTTDMAKIQHQPIYIVEVINELNQFKFYTLIFGADTDIQVIDLLTQLANHNNDHLAHIAQITWSEFKEHAFDLSLCCQLYHTSPIIMKSNSLYSHISESLISTRQMLHFSEDDAHETTPLLLLQENKRFRVIHGTNRLALGASLNMYPCIILNRSSGVTWQMVREQLKYLPKQVNVYELFEALKHSIHM